MRASYLRALPRGWRHTARIFTALGDPHRQRIVLMFKAGERLSIAALAIGDRSPPARDARVGRPQVREGRQGNALLAGSEDGP